MVYEDRKSATSQYLGPGRNLVICCDGTGNEFGNENSNVVKLYRTLIINQDQIGYYHPGVGTMGAPNARGRLDKKWTRLKGLAFGAGLTANVEDAYRYLMQMYREGDHIYIFGFSRGAYTARALGGLLHVCGLLCPGNEGLIPYAMQLFSGRSREHRRGRALPVAGEFKRTFSRQPEVLIEFMGLWDTVSSVGWIYDPVILPDEGTNPIVKQARHAVSIDERRCFYRDKLWGAPFQPVDKEFCVPQDIRQVWFAGAHSDVGGSYPEEKSGLSKLALEWMLHEAYRAGLLIDLHRASRVLGRGGVTLAQPDPHALLHNSLKAAWWPLEFLPHTYYDKPDKRREWRIPLGARRTIPAGSVVHESVLQRKKLCDSYRPPNLPDDLLVEPRVTFPSNSEAQQQASYDLIQQPATK